MSQYLNLEYMFLDGEGKYNIPAIEGVKEIRDMRNWIEFDYAKRTTKKRDETGVHFFELDYKFQRLWEQPNKYIELLSQFGCVLSPDFSMYRDMPLAIQIFNKYRNHWLASFWQSHGITVIPNIGWSTPENYDWQFDGYPKHSIVAVSNIGCAKENEAKRLFKQGYDEMMNRLEPSEILFFSRTFGEFEGNVHYIRCSMDRKEDL